MANNIATQMRQKMDNIEAVVMAIENLSALSTVVNHECSLDFANLTHYLSTQLSTQFHAINRELTEQVLPFVADLKTMKVA
jgi:primosomal protein N''